MVLQEQGAHTPAQKMRSEDDDSPVWVGGDVEGTPLKDQLQPPAALDMQLRVIGIPSQGARSRVETQVNLCLQLTHSDNTHVTRWLCLALPEECAAKKQGKHKVAANDMDETLWLEAKVVCVSNPTKTVFVCDRCIAREKKRLLRAKGKAGAPYSNPALAHSAIENRHDRILLFNCRPRVPFSTGDVILPTRITCYCRHHREPVGFSICFALLDYMRNVIATASSPPIMITDDHKSVSRKLNRSIGPISHASPAEPCMFRPLPLHNPANETTLYEFLAQQDAGYAEENVISPSCWRRPVELFETSKYGLQGLELINSMAAANQSTPLEANLDQELANDISFLISHNATPIRSETKQWPSPLLGQRLATPALPHPYTP